jgi:glutamyl-Q tRNA(Asp) synthetase
MFAKRQGIRVSSRGGSAYRGRFAPSPTGDLHFGSLVAALGSWLRARTAGGAWIIRIEDLDPPREIPGAAVRMIETLAAFGMHSDEPIEYQSTRTAVHAEALGRLQANGSVFACRCSRSEIGAGGIHRCCAEGTDLARPAAWRVRVPERTVGFDDIVQGRQSQELAAEVGDFVVWRVEGWPAYQLAVVVDDAAQSITEVVRGADLLDSTPRQIYLQELLGLPTPAYLHLPLALDAEGRKLSKQHAALAVDPQQPLSALRAALAFLGIDLAPFAGLESPESMLALACCMFDVARIPPGTRPTPPPQS